MAATRTKETVRELLDHLPEDCTLEEVQYHLYVLQAIQRGQADVAEGRVLTHEQVAETLRRKWRQGQGE
jgi:predicted transcriptional regulator